MKELPKLGSKWLTNKGVIFTVERINSFAKCENTITLNITPLFVNHLEPNLGSSFIQYLPTKFRLFLY